MKVSEVSDVWDDLDVESSMDSELRRLQVFLERTVPRRFLVESDSEQSILPFRGIQNLGATCYLNVIIQSMNYITELRKLIFYPLKYRDDLKK